ncbi:hypothetical protein GCM10010170_025980 [Dactylosporangium salmoneum]|uniref:Uncharacterized protein n=1 Tax=Dactylosporangium salmoneum TaxID=53361 RepID=A0ABN3G188_9ACTN
MQHLDRAEYYAGRYPLALALAPDGRRHAGRGPQAVRLAVNGEARALGKLGRCRAAERAIAEAYAVLDRLPPEPDMTPCNSFGLYSAARAASALLRPCATTMPSRAENVCRGTSIQSVHRLVPEPVGGFMPPRRHPFWLLNARSDTKSVQQVGP